MSIVGLRRILIMVIVMSACAYGSESTAVDLKREDGQLLKSVSPRAWQVPTHFGARILGMAFVDATQKELAVVSEQTARNTGVTRTLTLYTKRHAKWNETYRFITPNAFGGMYPLGDDRRLVTTWVAGSASRTGVFYVSGNDVRIVLWLAWQQAPEFVDLDGDGELEVVAAVPTFPSSRAADEAEIYRWSGREYTAARRVPWLQRFK